jgi:hypothetical protein
MDIQLFLKCVALFQRNIEKYPTKQAVLFDIFDDPIILGRYHGQCKSDMLTFLCTLSIDELKRIEQEYAPSVKKKNL